mmetsp:Transcript_24723/g.58054  ORF Transcript_24723/g.58054 Transcript_24723/m.58054 type:complete len:300 (-) Transcript_24723:117-1016(-)|eukprot:CAMPEP_0197186044 /NCGR_PEP_ID=MMETSP1423-20130617/13092_1 /TAXON_ID=476441 /ORGANISM="Pseudo-nitzschia heimii, Strain UNC1101" /LENGTH=299 /DNA_ID=CAMNT_0042637243 /DNA_START=42 /DNA_END=941 /DNA_ORIENTATION=+
MIGRSVICGRTLRFRPSPSLRGYGSTPSKAQKDLPPPLPPRPSQSSDLSSKAKPAQLSPAKAKKEYIETRKRTAEFLKDPQANIARMQAEMDKTKEKLARVHDKPIWKRVIDRIRAKQHAAINLLAASMAYILAYRLHLQIKASDELKEQVELERTKNSDLRSLLRSLTTDEFSREVVAQAMAASPTAPTPEPKARSSWFGGSSRTQGSLSSSTSMPQLDALVATLRQKLEARIGDEGLGDEERRKKTIRKIWEENENRIENREEGLAELVAAIEVEVPIDDHATAPTGSPTKKRVFDM